MYRYALRSESNTNDLQATHIVQFSFAKSEILSDSHDRERRDSSNKPLLPSALARLAPTFLFLVSHFLLSTSRFVMKHMYREPR